MFTRTLLSATFAALLLGATAASAATSPSVASHGKAMHQPMRAATHRPHATRVSSRMTRRPARGADAQNAQVDQLNAQSLQRAQGH